MASAGSESINRRRSSSVGSGSAVCPSLGMSGSSLEVSVQSLDGSGE